MDMRLTKVTKIFLDIMFVMGIVVTATLYWTLDWYAIHVVPKNAEYKWQLLIIFTICGLCALGILWNLKKMFKTVLLKDCFVTSNVECLRRMGILSFVIAVAMMIRTCLFPTLASCTVVLVFIIAGLFSRVLAQVFYQAVAYKEENDYTI